MTKLEELKYELEKQLEEVRHNLCEAAFKLNYTHITKEIEFDLMDKKYQYTKQKEDLEAKIKELHEAIQLNSKCEKFREWIKQEKETLKTSFKADENKDTQWGRYVELNNVLDELDGSKNNCIND